MITSRAMVAGGALAPWPVQVHFCAQHRRRKNRPCRRAARGRLRYRDASDLARQEAANQALLSSAQLRDPPLAFRLGIHATTPSSCATISPQFRKRSTRRDGSSTVEDPSSAVDVIGIDIGKNSFQSLVWSDAVPSYCVKSGREARSKHGWPRCRLA